MGFTEIIVLGVVALLFIGPKQLPQVARVIGRTLNELKRATSDLTKSFSETQTEIKKEADKITSELDFRDELEKINHPEEDDPHEFEDSDDEETRSERSK